jgi:valyl-tRNA synthetase
MQMPGRPSLDGLERKWAAAWAADDTYRFDPSAGPVFAIDTPPPTISGALHIGTAFGYVQVDALARYRRMRGFAVRYPVGWDDNGLPTERRVQEHFGVCCEPTLPYDPQLVVEPTPDARTPVSRRTFVALCERLTAEFEREFEQELRDLGLSVDWSLSYRTIDAHARRVAQRAFLRNLGRGQAYAGDAPTMWDIDFRTAVAQAEFVDKPVPGALHRLTFAGNPPVEVETTRPELLPACVAVVVHPEDSRFQAGASVRTPLFGVEVPVLAHRLADPDKGTGAAMVCTFGDPTDVVWWRELALPTRPVLGRDGRIVADKPSWLPGWAPWPELAGATIAQARRRIVELLREAGALLDEPRPITHEVKFYEKGDRPLEIVTSRQWYLRNGARDADLRARLLARGRELAWHPDFMRVRYEHWVEGLTTDWLLSRQRFFGVPFPLWYPVDASGASDHARPILAKEDALPVDPQSDVPPGYTAEQRGVPGGFVGDPDVMDTWATSSLTPEITGAALPMDLRPQGPEIIRTWLFSTVLRAHLEHDMLPWRNALINGWILDPDRKKMSKSLGNTLTPAPIVAEFGADALRYWSCRSAPGTDPAVDRAVFKVGRRLAIKILNAARFVLGSGVAVDARVRVPLDRAMLAALASVVAEATAALDRYEYHRALLDTEAFFWRFCDDYLELVKQRSASGDRSARAALCHGLDVQLRLFAPFLPFVTEEVWSWWHASSIHRAAWPVPDPVEGDPAVLDAAAAVLGQVRRAKTEAKVSQRTPVARVTVTAPAEQLVRLAAAASDVQAAGSIAELTLVEGPAHTEVHLRTG